MRSSLVARQALLVAAIVVWFASALAWRNALTEPPTLIVTFLDVGQGDSTVIQTPSGHTMVVDTGRMTPEDDAGRSVVVPFLRSRGVNRIDALLLTHPDDDHIGGARSLIERIPVTRLLISELRSNAPNYRLVLDAATRNGVPIVHLARGQIIDFHDAVVVQVLNPPEGPQPRSEHPDNDGSIVTRVRFGQASVLLTGDAESVAEQDMASNGLDLNADVLKLGHHGSKTSSSDSFLDRVHPSAAIVSAGKRNVFGHPHPDVLARLERRGIRVFRTDYSGAIILISDGRTIRISTHLGGRR